MATVPESGDLSRDSVPESGDLSRDQPEPRRTNGSIVLERCPWLRRYDRRKPWLPHRVYLVAKRSLDLLLVVLAAPVLVLLLVLCALAVKIEAPREPVLFSQLRSGAGGRRFRLYKFRTMVSNAEELKASLAHLNQLVWPDFKIENDPRITKVGRFLRLTSLDELPQLFNVVRNDMSLVGPRPTFFAADDYSLWQTERLDVKPGVTGIWQLVGRGSVDFPNRSRLDISYVQRQRLSLDLEILLRTVPVLFRTPGT